MIVLHFDTFNLSAVKNLCVQQQQHNSHIYTKVRRSCMWDIPTLPTVFSF